MNARSLSLLSSLFFVFLSAACAPPSTTPAESTAHLVPLVPVTEEQDEWLHGHCAAKTVMDVPNHVAGDSIARVSGANFGEVVYEDDQLHAVAFACTTRPEWRAAGDWIPLETLRASP